MDCDSSSFQPGLGRLESIETRTKFNFKFERVRGAFHHVGSHLFIKFKLFTYICHRFAEVARSPSRGISRKKKNS